MKTIFIKLCLQNLLGIENNKLGVKFWAKYVDNQSFYHQIQIIWYGHPAQTPLSSVTFHDVIVIQYYSLYFNAFFG